jgi:hypothetical protein
MQTKKQEQLQTECEEEREALIRNISTFPTHWLFVSYAAVFLQFFSATTLRRRAFISSERSASC